LRCACAQGWQRGPNRNGVDSVGADLISSVALKVARPAYAQAVHDECFFEAFFLRVTLGFTPYSSF